MKRLQNRTLNRIDNGKEIPVELRFEDAFFSNHKFIVTDDEFAVTVGVVEGGTSYLIGDRVEIVGDCRGYITPGISHSGFGTITEIERHNTDHYYAIQMDSGEHGSIKSARIATILSA